ncbi:MAG: hypothetical protein OEZ39_02390 [Gammaproteobacteria bacterium]|nr:hypothetical protein [Gammaproteobacteria bacterium]MDH5650703.1 hypothetical protein [Gammaproteobacteria bacterium]
MIILTINAIESRFHEALLRKDRGECADSCFMVMYGLPAAIQQDLALLTMRRYLPVFQQRNPDIQWPRIILDQPEAWFAQHGRATPEEPDSLNPADAAFLFCYDAILNALANTTNPAILTSSCMCAINSAIDATGTHVWMTTDPEALTMWQQQGYFPGRSVVDNADAVAAMEQEWQIIGNRLFTPEHRAQYNAATVHEAEQALAQWQAAERSLILPDRNMTHT